ncbi:hypothetical protein NDU88_005465 [Pleurodeles waltl]|uniref:Uncharacterized protein n=1 Tax=Pleurodeles waltl TaxID=8319 RepID=A0AAV7QFQ6_PLEWA|nr:hypothetical protein NDU88_005465 [Pleurodeles waltl]
MPDESMDECYARLHEVVSTFTLPNEQDEIRAQFIWGCSSAKLHEHIVKVPPHDDGRRHHHRQIKRTVKITGHPHGSDTVEGCQNRTSQPSTSCHIALQQKRPPQDTTRCQTLQMIWKARPTHLRLPCKSEKVLSMWQDEPVCKGLSLNIPR